MNLCYLFLLLYALYVIGVFAKMIVSQFEVSFKSWRSSQINHCHLSQTRHFSEIVSDFYNRIVLRLSVASQLLNWLVRW